MLTSLVLLSTSWLKALGYASTPDHEWVLHATDLLQLLASIDRTLLNTSKTFQICLRTQSFLTSDLTELAYLGYKSVTDKGVVKH